MLDRTTAPEVHTMGTLTLPPQRVETLDNGLTIHSYNGGTQDVCQLTIVWLGGLAEAPTPAVAHLMASMLREGTHHKTSAEISEIVDFNGAILKPSVEAHITMLHVSVLNSKIRNILPLLREIICEASFPEDKFRVLKDIDVKERTIALSKVMTICHEAVSPLVKGRNNPLSIYQTPEEVAQTRLQDVRDYYHKVVTSRGCRAFIGGRLDDGIYDEIKQMLASLPGVSEPVSQLIMPFEAEAPQQVEIIKPGAVQAAVSMAIPAPARSHPDYVPLRYAVVALGGYFGSRLMKNIREEKGYTYGIGAYLLGSQEGSYIAISAQTDEKYVEPLIAEVRAEIMRLAEEPLPDDELFRLKQYLSSTLMLILDSPFTIIDYYATLVNLSFPKGYYDMQVYWAHHLDAAKIMEMAKTYINPDHLRIAVVK